jgi:hypothetical protein
VLSIRKTPTGPGHQYEIKWHGLAETTWEAASRVRKQIPALVQAFDEAQQQHSADDAVGEGQDGADREGAAKADDQLAGEAIAADGSSMRAQMEAMQRLLREQAQQLQQLRASPAPSLQPSPQLSPQQSQRRVDVAASAPAPAAAAHQQQSRFARKEPRAQDLREYDGASGAKLDAWLDELGAAIDLFQLNGREAVDFGASRLRGAARQWWNTLSVDGKAGVSSAATLAAALRARFQPITTERTAREQLRGLRQGSRHVNEYIADFQRLHALLPDMSSADALFAFESGLSAALAEKLRVQGVPTLNEAIAMAARVGGLTFTSSQQNSRAAAANQMDVDDGDGASLDDRIARAVLSAMQAQGAGGASLGARTQTHRGYLSERGRGGAARGGRGGRFGGRGAGPRAVPGVPADVVEQRRSAGQCYRCGSAEHRSFECPNATSASQPSF